MQYISRALATVQHCGQYRLVWCSRYHMHYTKCSLAVLPSALTEMDCTFRNSISSISTGQKSTQQCQITVDNNHSSVSDKM